MVGDDIFRENQGNNGYNSLFAMKLFLGLGLGFRLWTGVWSRVGVSFRVEIRQVPPLFQH